MIRYRPEIDGLRALAIASVVLFHAGVGFLPGGYVGVDIFFVISGYLITSIISKEMAEDRFSFRGFYARRARRILPAQFFLLLLVTIVCFVVFLPAALVDYGKTLIYTVLFGANFRLAAATSYFEAWSAENPLLHMWSLAVEEQYYFIWPALLFVMRAKLSSNRLLIMTGVLAVSSLAASEILVHIWPKTAFYHLPARGWELLAGALVALDAFPAVKRPGVAEALSFAGLGLMILPILLYTKNTAFPGFAALPPVLGCALVIHCETHVRTRAGALLSLRPVVFLGLISYSLYLWHWPCLSIPASLLFRDLNPVETVFFVALALALSIFSWKFVERPFRHHVGVQNPALAPGWVTAFYRKHLNVRALAALGLTAFLIACGSFFQSSQGVPQRLSAATQELLSSTHNTCPLPSKIPADCKLGGTGLAEAGAFVLWGDSHAAHYLPALEKLFSSGTALMFAGCPPLLNTTWVDASAKPFYPNCAVAKSEALRKIKELKPKLVIIAGRWAIFEGSPYGLEKRPRGYFIRGPQDRRDLETTHRVFETGLRDTLKFLTDTGARVVVLGQTPEMGRDVKSCAALWQHLGFGDERCASIPRAEVERRQAFINKTLASVAAENPNVTVFWPMPFLCNEKVCDSIRDGELLYADGDHLSRAGALLLKDGIAAALNLSGRVAAAGLAPPATRVESSPN